MAGRRVYMPAGFASFYGLSRIFASDMRFGGQPRHPAAQAAAEQCTWRFKTGCREYPHWGLQILATAALPEELARKSSASSADLNAVGWIGVSSDFMCLIEAASAAGAARPECVGSLGLEDADARGGQVGGRTLKPSQIHITANGTSAAYNCEPCHQSCATALSANCFSHLVRV